ncbi:MAG: hypothetical protein U1E65_30900 [Myxococcota bacterium]
MTHRWCLWIAVGAGLLGCERQGLIRAEVPDWVGAIALAKGVGMERLHPEPAVAWPKGSGVVVPLDGAEDHYLIGLPAEDAGQRIWPVEGCGAQSKAVVFEVPKDGSPLLPVILPYGFLSARTRAACARATAELSVGLLSGEACRAAAVLAEESCTVEIQGEACVPAGGLGSAFAIDERGTLCGGGGDRSAVRVCDGPLCLTRTPTRALPLVASTELWDLPVGSGRAPECPGQNRTLPDASAGWAFAMAGTDLPESPLVVGVRDHFEDCSCTTTTGSLLLLGADGRPLRTLGSARSCAGPIVHPPGTSYLFSFEDEPPRVTRYDLAANTSTTALLSVPVFLATALSAQTIGVVSSGVGAGALDVATLQLRKLNAEGSAVESRVIVPLAPDRFAVAGGYRVQEYGLDSSTRIQSVTYGADFIAFGAAQRGRIFLSALGPWAGVVAVGAMPEGIPTAVRESSARDSSRPFALSPWPTDALLLVAVGIDATAAAPFRSHAYWLDVQTGALLGANVELGMGPVRQWVTASDGRSVWGLLPWAGKVVKLSLP